MNKDNNTKNSTQYSVLTCKRKKILKRMNICICKTESLCCTPETNKIQLYSNKSKIFLKGYCCSVTKSCPALCDPMDCSSPGFPILHYLPEFVQTLVR